MNIAVVGLGYIGLPTAALFANCGHRVYGFDANVQLRRSLKLGNMPAMEQPVQEAVREALHSGRFHVVDRVPGANAYILCLPTPTHEGKPDLSLRRGGGQSRRCGGEPRIHHRPGVDGASGSHGTQFSSARWPRRARISHDFHVAHCPERVIPGAIMDELRNNARVVGGRTPQDAEIVRALYASVCEAEIATTTTTVAEFVKVVENTFRDVNIAFANELALVRRRARRRRLGNDRAGEQTSPGEHSLSRARASAATVSRSIRTSSRTQIRSIPNSSNRRAA